MKSVIQIDESWTPTVFRNIFEKANEILTFNNLPSALNPFARLATQQKQVVEGVYDESTHVQDIKKNLDDWDKSLALASMSGSDWVAYSQTQLINGFLSVPELLVTDRTSVPDQIRKQIMEKSDLFSIRRLLQPDVAVDVIPGSQSTAGDSGNWFWKPTGDVMFGIEGQQPMEIPCYPESVKDTTSATWSQEMTTYQHYEPKQTFKGSGPRTVSCTFKIHRAMWTGNQDSGDSEKLVAYMESACYPDYDTQAAEPPLALLLVGNSVRIKGILTSFDKSYQGPIGPDNCYDEVIISISITEVSDNVLSTAAVRGGLAGWR